MSEVEDCGVEEKIIDPNRKVETSEVGVQTDPSLFRMSEVLKRDGGSEQERFFEWTPFAELHLLHALNGMKPIGPVYHFMIVAVHERFCRAMGMFIPIEEVKRKLNTFYDFEAAKRILGIPGLQEEEFALPPEEFNLDFFSKPAPPKQRKKSDKKNQNAAKRADDKKVTRKRKV